MKDHCKKFKVLILLLVCTLVFLEVNAQSTVMIHEFMAINQTTIVDDDGDYSDWIEIYNPTGNDINLQGWSLTDNNTRPQKWIFPHIEIRANGFLLVFASGKDRKYAEDVLHTNFKLSGNGEYLALFDPQGFAVTEFDPFPAQHPDISYGFSANEFVFLSEPSPGTANTGAVATIVPTPVFSKKHGFYENPFNLEITCDLGSASIYYTTDGSEPAITNGTLYSAPINVNTTSIIRAVALVDTENQSASVTQTYLFLDHVLNQPNDPPGYPSTWGPYLTIPGTAIADYEMDPELIGDPAYAALVKEALLDLPTISIVTKIDNLFGKTIDEHTGGIYIYTGGNNRTGLGWERPASFEYFNHDHTKSLQVNCGLRIQGGQGRVPEKSPKHSFRVVFRKMYGPSHLDYPFFGEEASSKINSITLRAGFCNAWYHWEAAQRERAQYIRDSWAKAVQKKMGHPSSHNHFAHLYINGLYWGLYNPSERIDDDFGEAYFGGKKEEYDVIKDYTEVLEGNIIAWDKMMAMANAGLSSAAAYHKIQGNNPDGTPNPDFENLLDMVNFIDYMLINFYGGNTDWDHHNWAAVRNRVNPGKGFSFICWDSEHILKSVAENVVTKNNSNCPTRIFQKLRENAEFRRLFADRVLLHCYNDGLLSPTGAKKTWDELSKVVENAVVAEAARWGDYRRDVHPYSGGPYLLYTKATHWIPQQNFMANTYFPQRTQALINQLRALNLYPNVDAPVFKINSQPVLDPVVQKGDILSMSSDKGVIYYTIDGSDPVNWPINGGSAAVSPSAKFYSQAITLNHSFRVKARVIFNGEWSAMIDHSFIVPSDFHHLKITEVHYHPHKKDTVDGDQFEFIEIKNTGSSDLELEDFAFVKGIHYKFKPDSKIKTGDFIILARSSESFFDRYGFYPYDEFQGKLDNDGERIIATSIVGDTIISFKYNNSINWPQNTNGDGYSLVPTELNPVNDQDSYVYWRASHEVGGSPGADDLPGIWYIDDTDMPPIEPDPILNTVDGTTQGDILDQNYPNPFSDFTYFNYKLDGEAIINLSIYNVMGQEIVTLVEERQSSGTYLVPWNGTDKYNNNLKKGIYFFRLEIQGKYQNRIITKKMVKI